MPYRRLPTTDQARRRALAKAIEKGNKLSPSDLAFSRHMLMRIKTFSLEYESALQQHKFNIEKHLEKDKELNELQKKARLYVSHFIHVLNFAIMREEIDRGAKKYYGMEHLENSIPPLNNEAEILEWGEKIIAGEKKRQANSGSPIYNPSIAMVKIHFDAYKDAVAVQKTMKERMAVYQDKINNVRKNGDALIQELWNEIEETFDHLEPKYKRQKAEEYGIVYIYRKGEIKKLSPKELQRDLMFEFFNV